MTERVASSWLQLLAMSCSIVEEHGDSGRTRHYKIAPAPFILLLSPPLSRSILLSFQLAVFPSYLCSFLPSTPENSLLPWLSPSLCFSVLFGPSAHSTPVKVEANVEGHGLVCILR